MLLCGFGNFATLLCEIIENPMNFAVSINSYGCLQFFNFWHEGLDLRWNLHFIIYYFGKNHLLRDLSAKKKQFLEKKPLKLSENKELNY